MKAEYINLFTVFANNTEEVTIVFKQETGDPVPHMDENGKQKLEVEFNTVDMYKIILNKSNAQQLAELLVKCLENADKGVN